MINEKINEKDVEILLASLSTGTEAEFANLLFNFAETEFANLLFNFVQAGLVDMDRFRNIIIGARALAFDDGFDAAITGTK